jgi:hypothetical protein
MPQQMRVGDAERDAAAAALRDACMRGELTIEELDQRVTRVLQARTAGELQEQLSDLPVPSPAAGWNRRTFWPGIAPFHERRRLASSVDQAYAEALREIVPRMDLAGYHLIDEVPPRRLIFSSTAGGNRVTLMLHPDQRGGTQLDAFGHAPRAVRKAFAELRD